MTGSSRIRISRIARKMGMVSPTTIITTKVNSSL